MNGRAATADGAGRKSHSERRAGVRREVDAAERADGEVAGMRTVLGNGEAGEIRAAAVGDGERLVGTAQRCEDRAVVDAAGIVSEIHADRLLHADLRNGQGGLTDEVGLAEHDQIGGARRAGVGGVGETDYAVRDAADGEPRLTADRSEGRAQVGIAGQDHRQHATASSEAHVGGD